MPVPYTPDAVKAIRHAQARGRNRGEVRETLGWDAAMLDRVCVRHGIQLASGEAPAVSPPLVPAKAVNDAPVLDEWSSRSRQRKPTPHLSYVNVTFGLPEELAAKFLARVEATNVTRSGLASRIIKAALVGGAHRIKPSDDRRSLVFFTTCLRSELFDGLCRHIGFHGSMSALCAAIIEQHFRDTA